MSANFFSLINVVCIFRCFISFIFNIFEIQLYLIIFYLISNWKIHFSAFHFAAQNGYYDIAKMLVERKEIDVNQKSISFLISFRFSCEFSFSFYVMAIYKTALHLAAQKGHPDIVRLLLEQPTIDVNCKTIYSFALNGIFFKFFLILFLLSLFTKFILQDTYKILLAKFELYPITSCCFKWTC